MAPTGSCPYVHPMVEYMQRVQLLLDEMEEQVQTAVDNCQDRFGRIKKMMTMMVEDSRNERERRKPERCAKSEYEDFNRNHPEDKLVERERRRPPRANKGDAEDPLTVDLSLRNLRQQPIDNIEDVYDHTWHGGDHPDTQLAGQFPHIQKKTGPEESKAQGNIVPAVRANAAPTKSGSKFFLGTPPNSPTPKCVTPDVAKDLQEVPALPAASIESAEQVGGAKPSSRIAVATQTCEIEEKEQQTELATLPPSVPPSSSSSCHFLGIDLLPPVRADQNLASLVAVIVPYRENSDYPGRTTRYIQWQRLKTRIEYQIRKSKISWLLVLVEQSKDGQRFNRGELLNVGFLEAQRYCEGAQIETSLESVIFHDVDMIPDTDMLSYYELKPRRGEPHHLSSPEILDSSKYGDDGEKEPWVGGVLALHPDDIRNCNGFALGYWGWGCEEIQLRMRLEKSGGFKKLLRPDDVKHGRGYNDMDTNDVWQQFCSPEIKMTPSLRSLRDKVVGSRVLKDTSEVLSQDWRKKNGLAGMDGQYEIKDRKLFQLSEEELDITDTLLGDCQCTAPQPRKGIFLRLTAHLKASPRQPRPRFHSVPADLSEHILSSRLYVESPR